MEVNDQLHTAAALLPEKEPAGSVEKEAGRVSEVIMELRRIQNL
jgi:hypothetical protein